MHTAAGKREVTVNSDTRLLGEVILFGSQFPHQHKTFGPAYLPTIPFIPSAITEHFSPQPKLGLGQKKKKKQDQIRLQLFTWRRA